MGNYNLNTQSKDIVGAINEIVNEKQDTLTAGTGIEITPENQINVTLDTLADDEDIQSKENDLGVSVLKFADRSHDAANFSGNGYKILRKNISGSKNILTQGMMSVANTTYEIRYNFDLDGQTIQIPSGCVLMFNGGSIDNGCLLGNNTAIIAGAYKIFGDNLILHQYCFVSKMGDYGENINKLLWSDVVNKKVIPERTITSRNWILTNDSGVRASNRYGNCVFRKTEKIELNVDSDFLLNANPGAFTEITISTVSVVENNLNTATYLLLSRYKNGNILKIPHLSKWCFFYSNNVDDDLNETYIQPGTEIDLNTTIIYCTSLNSAMIYPEASTWSCAAKLEWFVGDNYYKSFVEFYNSPSIPDQSNNIQRALDSSMDIISNIKGIIPTENTLYSEVRKKIEFGAAYNLTDDSPFESNAKYKVKFSVPATIILGLANKDVFVQRTTINFSGGLLTTYFATEHDKNIWVVDMDYYTSYSNISTSLLGKKANGKIIYTNAAFYANDNDNTGSGYASFCSYNIYAKQTKYGIYASQNNSAYLNSSSIKAFIFDYYEAVHIRRSLEASTIDVVIQPGGHTTLGEFDGYRHAYISTNRSTINVVTWDMGLVPESRKIFISANNYIMGNSATRHTVGDIIQNYRDYGKSINKEIIITQTANTSLRLPLLENVFAGINADMTDEYYCCKVSTKSDVNIETYNDKITSLADDEISINNIDLSVYQIPSLFNVASSLLPAMTLEANEFIEIYFSLKERFTLDKGVRFKLCAFDFGGYTNVFNRAKIIFTTKNDVKEVIDVDLTEGASFAVFQASKLLDYIKSCVCRLYGKQENKWGLGYGITEPTYVIPQIRGYSLHESCNYFDRRFQKILYTSSNNRPIDALLGESIYDFTLRKPIWWNGSSWVDAMGEVV